MDTVKAVIIILMIIAILVIASLAILVPLKNTAESTDARLITVVNETGAWINDSGYPLTYSTAYNFRSPSVIGIVNGSSGLYITPENYTITGGRLYNNSAKAWQSVNFTYTYLYSGAEISTITGNYSNGTTSFFGNVPTFFTLLGVIVLILIIAIVIVAVTRFRAGEGSLDNY